MPNPNEYLAKESLLALKQDKLVAGDNITIDPITNRISAQTGAGTVTDVKVDNVSVVNASGIANVDLSGKQNTLTPGTNITIQNNVISATGGTEVEANPADLATDTLTTIDIDGTVYDIAGSGGSSVVPNPQGSPTEQLNKLSIDNVIYSLSGSGNANYAELTREEYDALPDADKNNDTIYFVKDPTVVEVPSEGMLIGEYYGIHNSKLNPDYVWSGGIKFFFNDSDFRYCLSQYTDYGYNPNAGMHPYYEHGDSNLNVLITQQMPADTHYVAAYHSVYGLNCTTLIFIPKELIDSGKAVLMMQTFYTSEACELQYTYVWNDWTKPENYAPMITVSVGAGMRSFAYNDLNILQSASVTGLWFTNCPLLGGDYLLSPLTQEEIDTYLATRQDNYPRYYNVNYFTFDHVMTPDYVGTVYLNSVDYTDRIDEIVSNVLVDGESVVIDGIARIDLSGKQDILTAGTNITITDNTISATDTDALTELTDVNISSPTDGQALIYDATNQKWINGSGGGGTTVVPNPQGTPTDTLSTIQIGNDIFEIAGGGSGGGGRSFSMTDLLTSPVTNPSTITLTDDIDNYDALVFELGINAGGADQLGEYTLYTSMLSDVSTSFTYIYLSIASGYSVFYGVYKSGSNELTVAHQGQSGWTEPRTIYRIKGVKFGSSGGESGGYTSTKIWDYIEDNSGVISYGSYTHTLNDNINNYDMLAIENVSASSDLSDANWNSSNLWYVDVNMLNSNINANYITYTSLDQRATRFYIKDTTFQATSNNDANTNGTVRVFGIKFGGGGSGTNVEPNPIDEPTDTLSTIRIGDTVYDIAGSGSHGSNYFETTLYENQTSSQQSTLSLSESVFDFDQIVFMINRYANPEGNCKIAYMFPTSELATNTVVNILGWSGSNDWLYPVLTANDTFTVTNVGNASGFYIKKVLGIKTSSSGGSGGTTSEIIPITAGDGTTSRTFTFDRIPKKISMQYVAGGWGFYRDIIWGTDRSYYQASQATISDSATYIGVSGIMCDETTKSITITGLNAIQASNTTDIVGYMFVDYGEGSTSGGSEDISDMTWTQIISQAGGAWSSTTTIPSGTTYVALVVDHDNKAYMPQTFKLSDWDKYAGILNHSLVEWGFDWKVGSSYDTVQIEYDSTNKTIKTYAGYSGLTLKTYALS